MEITVENHNDGDVLTYPLAVLRGTVARKECTRIYINASEEGVEHVQCDVVSGAFIAVYELQPGRNELKLAYETDELEDDTESVLTLVLLYEEPSSERAFVRPVYLLPADVDFDGSFQSPDTPECPNDIESGFRRLRTAALIVQTAVAEMMHARGHGRRTIALGEVTKCAIPDLPRTFTLAPRSVHLAHTHLFPHARVLHMNAADMSSYLLCSLRRSQHHGRYEAVARRLRRAQKSATKARLHRSRRHVILAYGRGPRTGTHGAGGRCLGAVRRRHAVVMA